MTIPTECAEPWGNPLLRLTKKVDYALIAMRHLALRSKGHPTSARSIAREYEIPPELLAKILQRLVRRGLLVSEHGTNGGYKLARAPSELSVAEVIVAIDGPIALTACSETDDECEQFLRCTVRDPLWQIRNRIIDSLESFSINDLALY